jgi:hypothetical protein
MRLIDADKIDFNEVFVGASKFAEDTRQAGKMLIDAQPTAYDVDKVIEEIEEWTARINVIIDKSGKTGQVDVIGSNKAIKIVEGGGVSGDN